MAWTKTYSNAQVGNPDHLTPPASFASMAEQEQFYAAREAAITLIRRKVVGHNTNYTVVLSGTGNSGHPSGDTVTVTVTAP
jgi:hypothetical protein